MHSPDTAFKAGRCGQRVPLPEKELGAMWNRKQPPPEIAPKKRGNQSSSPHGGTAQALGPFLKPPDRGRLLHRRARSSSLPTASQCGAGVQIWNKVWDRLWGLCDAVVCWRRENHWNQSGVYQGTGCSAERPSSKGSADRKVIGVRRAGSLTARRSRKVCIAWRTRCDEHTTRPCRCWVQKCPYSNPQKEKLSDASVHGKATPLV